MSVLGEGVGPQLNKFQEVSSDGHQMSVVGVGLRYPGPCLGAGDRYHI